MVITSLVGVVVEVMGDTFPELKQHEAKIKEIIAEEEASFERTLDRVWFIMIYRSKFYYFLSVCKADVFYDKFLYQF